MQTLKAHIEDMHGKRGESLPKTWTFVQLSKWHAREHHRYSPNHWHAGRNDGPSSRPEGWYTGEDAVKREGWAS